MDRSLVAARPVIRVLPVVMAASTVVGGYAHLELYNDGYEDIPVGNIGRQFLLNAIGAVAIAVGLVMAVLPAWPGRVAAGGGIAWGAIWFVAFLVLGVLSASARGRRPPRA